MKKVLFSANVFRHLTSFHIPYMKMLQKKGYKIYAACNDDYGNKKEVLNNIGVECIDIPFNRFPFHMDNIKSYKYIKNLLEKNDFDIIHVHTPVASLIVRQALHDANNIKKNRLIYSAHGFHFYKGSSIFNWLIFYPLEKMQMKNAKILVTTNEEDYQLAVNKKFKTEVRLINGVGVEDFEIISKQEELDLKKELKLEKNDVVLFTAAEFNGNKNQRFIIENWQEIKHKNPEAKIFFAGEGPLKNDLAKYCKENGLKDVYFLGFRTDVQKLLQISDIFFLLSKREGLPKSLMEAMLAGKPSVVTDIRGNRDLIDDNVQGFRVEVGNNEVLKYNFNKLIEDSSLRRKMGENAQTKIEKFKLENITNEFEKVYAEILKED